MALPDVVSRDEWLAARTRLLAAEKEATRARDALNADRRRLPMVAIDKEYRLAGPAGPAGLADLFEDRRQLIVQHVMFDPAWAAACSGCTAGVDELAAGMLDHLRSRDTSYALVSRAPLAKLQAYQASRGWTVPWYSSHGSDFNADFQATLSPQQPVYNYQRSPDLAGRRRPGGGAGGELLPARRRRDLPHLLDLGQGHRHHRQQLLDAGPDRAGPAGGLGGAQGPGGPAARRGSELQ